MSDPRYVLDSSAVLAVIFEEPGASVVYPILEGAEISAVNFSEIVAKLIDERSSGEDITIILRDLNLNVIAFDQEQAMSAGTLRAVTRVRGLSLGDRACIALAATRGATVVTSDRAWAELPLPIPILLIR